MEAVQAHSRNGFYTLLSPSIYTAMCLAYLFCDKVDVGSAFV